MMVSSLALLALLAQPESGVPAPAVVAPPKPKLGIFSISMTGVDPGLQTAAIDALATAAARTELYQVVSRSELDAMLGTEKIKEVAGCDDMSCLAEIGAAVGVERVLGGSVALVDSALVVSLQLVNVVYASTENRITASWKGSPAELPELLGAAAELLLVPVRTRTPGSLTVSGIPAQAIVSVDGRAQGSGACEIAQLAVGVHVLRVEAPGFSAYEAPFVIRLGQSQQLAPRLEPQLESPPPVYTRWWFWGAIGVAAIGGVVMAVAARGDDNPAHDNAGNDDSTGQVTFVGTAPGVWGGAP